METGIFVQKANYVNGYVIDVTFNDNTTQRIDFETFLNTHSHPQYNKYKEIKWFKTFTIENGNIVWGKNWDLIFSTDDLYNGKIE